MHTEDLWHMDVTNKSKLRYRLRLCVLSWPTKMKAAAPISATISKNDNAALCKVKPESAGIGRNQLECFKSVQVKSVTILRRLDERKMAAQRPRKAAKKPLLFVPMLKRRLSLIKTNNSSM